MGPPDSNRIPDGPVRAMKITVSGSPDTRLRDNRKPTFNFALRESFFVVSPKEHLRCCRRVTHEDLAAAIGR
jgi:hypothetical protein